MLQSQMIFAAYDSLIQVFLFFNRNLNSRSFIETRIFPFFTNVDPTDFHGFLNQSKIG